MAQPAKSMPVAPKSWREDHAKDIAVAPTGDGVGDAAKPARRAFARGDMARLRVPGREEVDA